MSWAAPALRAGWGCLRGANRREAGTLRAELDRIRARRRTARAQNPQNRARRGRLSAREHVIQYYISVLDLGSEKGLDRKPGQTPYSYEQTVEAEAPELREDFSELTETLIDARYTRRPVELPQAEKAGSLSQRIVRFLRSRGRNDE